MNTQMRSIYRPVFAVSTILLLSSVARADTLNLTLLSPVFGAPGSTISVTGTIAAPSSNNGTVYLNSDSLSLAGPFTLNATYTNELFGVQISPLATPNNYTGFFTILGGDSTQPSALNTLSNTAAFRINVTPEPTTVFLLSIGLLIILLRALKQRKVRIY